jgi:hypothetical protein
MVKESENHEALPHLANGLIVFKRIHPWWLNHSLPG